MKIQSSKLREWNTKFEFSTKYNISDCSTYPLTLKELFEISGKENIENYRKISFGYNKVFGEDDLRREISKLYKNLSFQNILITNGAIEAIFLVMNQIADKGDNIVVQFPIYQALKEVARVNGVEIRNWEFKFEENFKPDLDKLIKLINSKTKAIVINQPLVPTGSIIFNQELKQVIEIAKRKNIYIISDEVCLPLADKKKVTAISDLYEFGISIGDVSKPFGAGGLRIGWIAMQNSRYFEKLLPLKGYTTMSSSIISEYLAYIILKNSDKIIIPRLKTAERNYSLLKKFIKKNELILKMVEPKYGVTAFLKLRSNSTSEQFCKKLINEFNTLIVPGSVYEMEKFLRIGFGCREDIFIKGINNLQLFLDKNF